VRCEPIPIGAERRVDLSGLNEVAGIPVGTRFDLSVGLGGKGALPQVDARGVQISAMVGTRPSSSTVSLCAPPRGFTADPLQPPLDFDDQAASPPGGYDVAFALSSSMLSRGLRDAYDAGALCATLSSQVTPFLSTGQLSRFLPSLKVVTGGKDLPMTVLLRPQSPPTVRIGRNTTVLRSDGEIGVLDPLLTLGFAGMQLEFYAPVDDRPVRVLTVAADVSLPLGLRPLAGAGNDLLVPVLGDLATTIGGVRVVDGSMLAEDATAAGQLLPAVVQLAQPLLASVLQPIALPSVLGMDVQVEQIAGAAADVAARGYSHLAVYAHVAGCRSGCLQARAKADARLESNSLRSALSEVRGPGEPGPQVEVEASALTSRGAAAEFSYRVDGGLWTPWIAKPRFTVRDPVLRFHGHHRIEVTAREAGDDHTVDPQPVALDVFVGG
jgi:hypothetical protein